MKMALVCDDLIQYGGQERLLVALLKAYPDADFYTSVISKDWKNRLSSLGVKIHTSFMQKLPFHEKLNKIYGSFFLHIFAYQSFDFSEYDLVLSISSRFSHHIITKPTTKHICYMNTPGRMFWEPDNYLPDSMFLKMLKPFLHVFRLIDYTSAQKVDKFVANSKVPLKRIKKYYKRESVVVYPFYEPTLKKYDIKNQKYFVVISRLVKWKRIDLVIETCERLGIDLVVIGIGPDKKRLKKLAKKHTTFTGYVNDDEKYKIISGCTALIHPQLEDFGITPLEAMSLGKPVIAYGKGGVLETVTNNTGCFFYNQTQKDLTECIMNFDPEKYPSNECKKQAKKFTKETFLHKISEEISLN